MKLAIPEYEEPDLNVASLIDMVFLLLVYFMASASLQKSEADLGIRLPGMVAQAQAVDMPDEQIIEIKESGHVILNGRPFDRPESQELPELVATLLRYRQSCEANRSEALITISADDNTVQQRVIDVMNACAVAKIRNVTFAAGGGEGE
jgi:biopolymer transport protein ExbD